MAGPAPSKGTPVAGNPICQFSAAPVSATLSGWALGRDFGGESKRPTSVWWTDLFHLDSSGRVRGRGPSACVLVVFARSRGSGTSSLATGSLRSSLPSLRRPGLFMLWRGTPGHADCGVVNTDESNNELLSAASESRLAVGDGRVVPGLTYPSLACVAEGRSGSAVSVHTCARKGCGSSGRYRRPEHFRAVGAQAVLPRTRPITALPARSPVASLHGS